MNTHDIDLPPLPDEDGYMPAKVAGHAVELNAYRPSTMEAYARAAIEADRKQRHLKEQAQLNQEWAALKGMQAQYEADHQSRDCGQCVPLSTDGKSVFIDGVGEVPLDFGGQARGEPVAPEGFRLIAVNETFDSLTFWLDRCEQKGHLENCADLVEPWEAFEYREVEAPQLQQQAGEPEFFTYVINGHHRGISETEPPDDSYDEGTLQKLYATPQQIPEGYKLVPIEPTSSMIAAARLHHEGEAYLPVGLYKAMLEAAPEVKEK